MPLAIAEVMGAGPVIPVIVLEKVQHAVPLAKALVAGGIRVLEVTLRTSAGLDSVRAIREQVPGAIVGTGTVTTVEELKASIDAGAQFGVSPGASPTLLAAVREAGFAFLPGTMTPSDVVAAREAGFKALGSVFADLKFCPTGGIDPTTAGEFLALPNVACVGGSWLAPPALVKAGDWAAIKQLAQSAAQLGKFPI